MISGGEHIGTIKRGEIKVTGGWDGLTSYFVRGEGDYPLARTNKSELRLGLAISSLDRSLDDQSLADGGAIQASAETRYYFDNSGRVKPFLSGHVSLGPFFPRHQSGLRLATDLSVRIGGTLPTPTDKIDLVLAGYMGLMFIQATDNDRESGRSDFLQPTVGLILGASF